MRLQRLVLHAGADDEKFALDLHPRLTVVTGAGRLEREGLLNELLGSLGTSRAGVHLELVDEANRSLAVFRPAGARHRVVDIDRGVDVTAEFERDGEIDLLGAAGFPAADRRRLLCISGPDLHSEAHHDDHVARLAQVDPSALWTAAAALREVQAELVTLGAEGSSTVIDAELVGLIEARHGELQRAVERLESSRSATFILGAALTLFAVLSVLFVTPALAVPLLAGGAGSTGISLRRMLQVRRAEAAEDEVLRSAGMSSYLSFQLHRVDGMVSSHEQRRQLVELSEIHREASACWRELAGDAEVEWAWANRADIEAARPRSSLAGTTRVEGLHAALSHRFHHLAIRDGARPPVVLDEPFAGVGDTELRELLALVLSTTDHVQLVLLTEDRRLAEWARLECLGGSIVHLELDADAPVAGTAAVGGRHALA